MTKTKKSADKKAAKAKYTSDESRSGQKTACGSVSQAGGTVPMDRRASRDRRVRSDRRLANVPVAIERRKLERRVKVSRRRQIDPTTCERDYTPEEIQFMTAMDEYKRVSGRMFPTCSEILEVLKKLGYSQRGPAESMPVCQPSTTVVEPQAPSLTEGQTAS